MDEFKNFRLETDTDGVAWLWLDKKDVSANVLSSEVLLELDKALDVIALQKPKGLVIISAKKSGFVAGADVNEFTMIKSEEDAFNFIRKGQGVFDKLEALPFPTVAAISGFCLGGGTELALACRYRVIADDDKTQLGLPEVKLGIHPGFGGVVRSVRKMGGLAAMDFVLTGRSLRPKAAKRSGLADMVVPERHLKKAAKMTALNPPPVRRPSFMARLGDNPLLKPLAASIVRKKTAEKANPAHYPSPFAAIDVWQKYGGDEERMMKEEASSVARLITGPAAKGLIRLFQLQDRLKGMAKKSDAKIKRLHVVGAGVMGGDIAAWSALRGLEVTLQDREAKFIAPAIQRAAKLFEKRLVEPRLVRQALDRLMPDVAGAGAARADLVIEAVFEDVNVKRELFGRLAKVIKPGAVLATNTSSIPLEEIAVALPDPGNLVGVHFFNPVSQMQIVEIVKGTHTSDRAVNAGMGYVNAIGKLPLPVKSSPGFLVNRILVPYLMEGILMEGEGKRPEEIDAAAEGFGMPMGPLFLADTVGLDVCLHVGRVFSEKMGMPIPDNLQKLVSAGNLGAKSGRGFYDHSGGRAKRSGPAAQWEGEIADRLMLRFLNECVACLREKIVEDRDLLDAGMVFGAGFAPFRGGPTQYVLDAGPEQFVGRLKGLEQKFGARFRPDAGWPSVFVK